MNENDVLPQEAAESEMRPMIYCIEIYRELEDVMVEHTNFSTAPTREEVLSFVASLDCNYDDKYGKINYYKVG